MLEERSRAGRPEPGNPKVNGKPGQKNRFVPELGLTQVLRQDQGNSHGQDGSTSPWGLLAQTLFAVCHEGLLGAELAVTHQFNQDCSPRSPGKSLPFNSLEVAHSGPQTSTNPLPFFLAGPQCNASVDLIGTCWPRSAVGQLVARPCPEYFYGVRYNTTSKMSSTGGDMVEEGWGSSESHVHQGLRGHEGQYISGNRARCGVCGIHQPKKKKALISQISGRVVSEQQLYKQVLLDMPLRWGRGLMYPSWGQGKRSEPALLLDVAQMSATPS